MIVGRVSDGDSFHPKLLVRLAESIELSFDELRHVILGFGFKFLASMLIIPHADTHTHAQAHARTLYACKHPVLRLYILPTGAYRSTQRREYTDNIERIKHATDRPTFQKIDIVNINQLRVKSGACASTRYAQAP